MALLEVYVDDVVITAAPQTESATCTVIRAPTVEAAGAYNETATCTVTHEVECSTTQSIAEIDYLTGVPDSSSIQINADVAVSINDKMMQGRFAFNGSSLGTVPDTYFKKITFAIPDYTGTNNIIFVGIFPSSETTYSAAGNEEVLTAYSYDYYLTMQYLSNADRTLLSVTDQGAIDYYRLNFDNYSGLFHEGDIIVGGTSGHSALVKEVYNMSHYLVVQILSGTAPYFTNGENLNVGGTTQATADGTAISYTVSTYYPEDWVERLLGGSYWATTTGIYPYRMANSATLWNTIQKTITFEEKETKAQAIQRVCEYMNYIFYVRWNTIAGVPRPCAYFIAEDDIDSATDGLDLPAKVTVTPTSYCVVSPANFVQDGGEKYNKIVVKCQSLTTETWYNSTLMTDEVENGDDIPIEYKEINADIATQTECDDRCQDLYDYYTTHIKKYNVTLRKRSDLRLLQQIAFSGFTGQITNGDYRIISINYVYRDGGTTNETRLTVVPEAQFKRYLNLNRTFHESISTINATINSILEQEMKVDVGEATDVTSDKVTLLTEQGLNKISRDAS